MKSILDIFKKKISKYAHKEKYPIFPAAMGNPHVCDI